MSALYLFSLILGGGFLLLSVLGGGGEGDIDLELEGGLDLDLDLDLEVEGLEMEGLEVDAVEGPADASDAGHEASRIFSVRTVVYALFGFGATGTILTQLGLGVLTTLGFSLVGGVASGLLVSLLFRLVDRTASGGHPGDASLKGLPGVVTLPMSAERAGTVMVERGGRRIALRALPHSASMGDPETWSRVVVVELEGGIARVSPLAADELDALGPGEP